MISSQHTVTTTASEVIAPAESWRTLYLHVVGNGVVYIGGSNVTSSNGMLTEKGAVPFQFILPANQSLYAVVASGTEDLRVLRPTAA